MLVAQPILDLHSEQIRQHELLIRMLDEHDDLIPPAAFLYIAERLRPDRQDRPVGRAHAIELIEATSTSLHLEVNISGKFARRPTLLRRDRRPPPNEHDATPPS